MTRPRSQKVRGYRDGGAVPLDVPDGAPAAVEETAPPPEAAAASEPTPEELAERARNESAVREALARQRQAEEIARLPPVERELAAAYPGMSMAERAFVMQHPEALDPQNVHVVAASYQKGQRIGLERNSPQLFNLVLDALQEHRQAAEGAARLDRETERQRLISAANASAGGATSDLSAATAKPPPRTSMPMSAPVSRSEVTYSGKPRESNTLTLEERQIAWTLPAPGMSKTEKEYLYLQNKKKYESMKASGEYTTERQR